MRFGKHACDKRVLSDYYVGLDSVGIYRLSGPAAAIQKYRTQINNRKCRFFFA